LTLADSSGADHANPGDPQPPLHPHPLSIRYKQETSMAETIDELTVSYTDGGIEVVQELDKAVLSKGSWTTILFRYREWDRSREQYGPEKYSIRRYQKRSGEYRQQSKFNISSRAQAQGLIDALQKWINEDD
jgi:hypothetical protein